MIFVRKKLLHNMLLTDSSNYFFILFFLESLHLFSLSVSSVSFEYSHTSNIYYVPHIKCMVISVPNASYL